MDVAESLKRIEFLKSGKFSDITITVTDGVNRKDFKLHRVILAKRSLVFAREIQDATKIQLNDKQPDTFYSLVHFLYSDEIKTVPIENLSELFCYAEEYEINDFRTIYKREINRQFNHTLYNLEYAIKFDDIVRQNRCEKVVQEQTKQVLTDNYLDGISQETILWVLNQNVLNVETDITLLEFLVRYRDEMKPSDEFMQEAKKKIRFLNIDKITLITFNNKHNVLSKQELTSVIKNIDHLDESMPAGFSTNRERRTKPNLTGKEGGSKSKRSL